jgi:uncharacterized protein YggE
MKKKNLLVGLSLMMVLAMSACATSPSPQVASRTITVSGTGQVYITPDVAYITIGVQSQAAKVTDVLNENNAQAKAISDALQGLGVDPKDIQTSAFNIYPNQNFSPEGKPLDTYYVVQNSVYITVRDLNQMGAILDAVVRSGANTVNSISFDVLDKTAALSEARTKAIENARQTADELAAAAGVTLGPLQTLNIYSSGGAVPVYDIKGTGGREAGSVPVSTGQLIISVDASLIYEIK